MSGAVGQLLLPDSGPRVAVHRSDADVVVGVGLKFGQLKATDGLLLELNPSLVRRHPVRLLWSSFVVEVKDRALDGYLQNRN